MLIKSPPVTQFSEDKGLQMSPHDLSHQNGAVSKSGSHEPSRFINKHKSGIMKRT